MDNMSQHTTIQLRKKVLQLSEKGKTSRAIASLLSVGKSTINDLLSNYRSGWDLKTNLMRSFKENIRVDGPIIKKSTAEPKKTAIDITRKLKEKNPPKYELMHSL